MKPITLLTILLFTFLFFSCGHHHSHEHHTFSGVPELQKRNVMLMDPVEEWDQIQTRFANLQKAVHKNPLDAKSKIELADIYMNEARVTGDEHYYTGAALHVLDQALGKDLKKDTNDANAIDLRFRALTMKAFVLASLHQFKDALEIGQQAVAINPHSSVIYGVLVDANVELGNYDEAIKMCEKMMDIRPDLRSYTRASYLREIHGDIDGAIEVMQLAVKAGAPGQEQTAWTRVNLGKLYERKGDFGNAEAQYGLTLMERPNYPYAIAGMARVKANNEDFDNAEKLLKKAIDLMPSPGFYEELAMLYKRTGDKEQERAFTEKAIHEMDHHHHHGSGSNHGLETAYLHLRLNQDYDAALKSMEEEMKMRPDNIEVNKVMAWAYFGKGDVQKASEHITKATATNSKDAETLCIAGLIKMQQGDTKQGKDLLSKAFENRGSSLPVDLSAQAENFIALKRL